MSVSKFKGNKNMKIYLTLLLLFQITVFAQPLKVFILGGQSNMVGKGRVADATKSGTLDNLVANHDEYDYLVDDQGDWVIRDDVWIWGERVTAKMVKIADSLKGPLEVGMGLTNAAIGPELQFGHVLGDHFNEQVLLIKCSWGAKSIGIDFLSPSSASYKVPEANGDTGFFYHRTLEQIKHVLSNLQEIFPGYKNQGYQIMGMAWFQGWSDAESVPRADAYEKNLANFIGDIRDALEIENMPFVIGLTGNNGMVRGPGVRASIWDNIQPAQFAMEDTVKYPQFAGNLKTVETRNFWYAVEDSPGNDASHWNLNAKSYLQIGGAMGEAMIDLLESQVVGVQDRHHQFKTHQKKFLQGQSSNMHLLIYNLKGALVYQGAPSEYKVKEHRMQNQWLRSIDVTHGKN